MCQILLILVFIIHQIFSLARDWSKRVTWVNIPQLELGNIPQFKNCARSVKDLKDNKDNSLHLGRKYALIFVLGHYLFLVAHSFRRATLSENSSPLERDNVRGQISQIFSRQMEAIVYIVPVREKYPDGQQSSVKIPLETSGLIENKKSKLF